MQRLRALITKEFLQIIRDPSSILIAFVLPLILLMVFGYGINLDSNRIKVGLVIEEYSPAASSLGMAFIHSPFLEVEASQTRLTLEQKLMAGHIRGIIVISASFASNLEKNGESAPLQVIADGTEPNIAQFLHNYTQGIVQVWLAQRSEERKETKQASLIQLEPRIWYNPELKSRHFLLPGSIAIILTLTGTLLTSLVIAREWERGTMEALLATPVKRWHILLGKLVPYYLLSIGSLFVCLLVATLWYEVPFRGSLGALVLVSTIFLLAALGQGLVISSIAKDQFLASQMALAFAFLPAYILSGFIFEISAMPAPIQAITHIFAARYFVTSLQTLFLAGDIWPLLWSCMGVMALIAVVLLAITARKTVTRLDA